MKIVLLSLLMTAALLSQSTVSLTGPTTARPGGTVPINLNFSGPANQVAGVQWQISFPAGGYSATVVPGAVSTSSGKGVQCIGDNSFCLSVGQNLNTYGSGSLALYSLKVPANAPAGSVTVNLSGVLAASPTGAVAVINGAASHTFSILVPQDINGDGKVDSADFNAMLQQVLSVNSTPSVPCNADPNADGKCDIYDVIAIVVKILVP